LENITNKILTKLPFLDRRLDDHMKEVVHGTLVALVLRVTGAALGLGFNILLAKACGAGGTGVYFLALTVISVATIFGRVGLDSALVRYIASNSASSNWKAIKGIYSQGVKIVLVFSSLSTLAVFFLAPLLAKQLFHKPELSEPLRWMSLSIIPTSFLMINSAVLRGLKKIKYSVFVANVCVPLFSIVGLYLWGKSGGINRAILAYVFGTLVTTFAGAALWRATARKASNVIGSFAGSDLLKSGIPLFMVASLSLMTGWISTFALGIWGTKEQIGIFGQASRVSAVISLVLLAVNGIAGPKIAALYKQGDLITLDSMARKSNLMMLLVSGPLMVPFLILPGFFMGMFGPEFRAGSTELVILSLGQFVNVATGSVSLLLVMSGNEKSVRDIGLWSTLLSLGLNLALVPSYGSLGAAVATSFCMIFQNIMGLMLVHSKLGIWTLPLFPRLLK